MRRRLVVVVAAVAVGFFPHDRRLAAIQDAATPTHLEDPFAAGWFVADTNGDGVADAVRGLVVVPDAPTAAQNAAAADAAARAAFASTGVTLPIVVRAADAARAPQGPRIFIGAPAAARRTVDPLIASLASDEGAVFAAGDDIVVAGANDGAILAAAEAYFSLAPHRGRLTGDPLAGIARDVNARLASKHVTATTQLVGLTFRKNSAAVQRAILRPSAAITTIAATTALNSFQVADVIDIELLTTGAPARVRAASGLAAAPPAVSSLEPKPLDLAELYTIKGLLGGSDRMPVPASVDARLYVPAGEVGIAMANLAARLALETTGVTIPIAAPADGVAPADVTTPAVVAAGGDSRLATEVTRKLAEQDTSTVKEPPLAAGEGELRVVDEAMAKHDAVIVRGDARGASAALTFASEHAPNLWDYGKQHVSLADIREDLHRFFSLRSSEGQATAALYHLDRWLRELGGGSVRQAEADVYVDLADPGLGAFVQRRVQQALGGASATVRVGSLHAGTQCCDHGVTLGYQSPKYFHQAAPTFTEDIAVPWEGTRLIAAVQKALPQIRRGDPVSLEVRVSEGPDMRRKLRDQLAQLVAGAGADRQRTSIDVLCSYKQGYSWLVDQIVPALAGQPVAKLEIGFARHVDPSSLSAISSPVRWEQELYPVDEILARALNIPLDSIAIDEMPASDAPVANGPTYRVHAAAADGRDLLTRDFVVKVSEREYSDTFPRYDRVAVETGWIRLASGSRVIIDERLETDPEVFWRQYQTETLPRIFKYLMEQTKGRPKQEYQPLFDTLLIDTHMSEPDYNIGLDRERISTLEMAMQEDLFYSTGNFFSMMGNLETGKPFPYPGRIITVVHPSDDGQDGRVRVEFYAKPAPNPLVRLRWTDANGATHERTRDLPALGGPTTPRLVAARVKAGETGVESLTWQLPADFQKDDFDEWRKLVFRDQLEHQIVSIEQAQNQTQWLELLHAAGVYSDAIAYPNLKRLAVEFELPRPRNKADQPAARTLVAWAVPRPATARPQIGDAAAGESSGPIVQWNEPIRPRENEQILARLARFPEVNVYWMGRSYLGQNLWAADIMLPTPSKFRSWAKETTLKAAIVYSGRQHADEVSSTSHIDRLAEEIVTQPAMKSALKQVNVVLHPITNPDGAELSFLLYKITPDNLLHTGYHGALIEDVSTAQWDKNTIYPESQTRRLLWEAWLPDAFLNPHGYPSHEWVQPFSGYAGWVVDRMGAYTGREWWLPRGWFTSLTFLRDRRYPHSEDVAYALRDRIAAAMNQLPELMALENRMNARYERFGHRWDPDYMLHSLVDGVRIYMDLKGTQPAPTDESFMGRYPAVTYDDAYTEAPDETAYGPYLALVASAGLAFDKVHLQYLSQGELRIKRTEKALSDGVQWKVERERPILPSSVPPLR